MTMSRRGWLLVGTLVLVPLSATFIAQQAQPAPSPPPASPAPGAPAAQMMRRIGTMSELMIHLIYPTADAVFYIGTRTPANEVEWKALEAKTLVLAESANLLMMPGRARDEDRWMTDAKLMLDAGNAAFKAAKDRDVAALEALNDPLYQSCVTCHQHYRPNYGRRRAEPEKPK